MDCKEQGGSEARPRVTQLHASKHHGPAHPPGEEGAGEVEEEVPHVVRPRLQSTQCVVEPEGEDGKGAVRLVAGGFAHGLAPKVVQEKEGEGCVGPNVVVVPHGKYVIVHQFARQTVPVADNHG